MSFEIKKIESSFVILALQHNPTILLSGFLKDSGIIDSDEEINFDNSFVTPAGGEIYLIDKTFINITPNKLVIKSPVDNSPFEKGAKYCKHQTFVSYKAIGINFKFELKNNSIDKLINFDDDIFEPEHVKVRFSHKKGKCYITLKNFKDRDSVFADFNFDYKTQELVKLGNIDFDIVEESKKNLNLAEKKLHEIFA
ncbi:MAG: hypothetical protein U5K71_17090 [Gracilimonas sp.]|nr:hypothetical protein [Gracilimonas sp.]